MEDFRLGMRTSQHISHLLTYSFVRRQQSLQPAVVLKIRASQFVVCWLCSLTARGAQTGYARQ